MSHLVRQKSQIPYFPHPKGQGVESTPAKVLGLRVRETEFLRVISVYYLKRKGK